MPLVRSPHRDQHDIDSLRSTLAERDAALAERNAELAGTQAALAAFRLRYREDVGQLHEELDELLQAIADVEAAERAKRVSDEPEDPTASPRAPAPPPPPRFTSDAVRKLFRDVAKIIHPDLAHDDGTRDRRHALMIEANRAYALGDEARLRWVLEAWEKSPEAVTDGDREATKERLVRRIAQIEEELSLCADELASIKATPLWQLKVMVDEAATRGKNLIAEMIARLHRDIMIARNRLDAIRWVP